MDLIKLDISTITEEQLQRMLEIENSCGLEALSRRILLDRVLYMDTYAMLDGEIIIGFITLHPIGQYIEGGLYISNLNVVSEYRRQGVATKLVLAACSAHAQAEVNREVKVNIRKDNTPAVSLFKKLGFSTAYEFGDDATLYAVMTVTMKDLLGIITTPRLLLKRITALDVMEGIRIYRDKKVNKTYMFPDLTEEAAKKLHDRLSMLSAQNDRYVRGIYLENKMIGFINDPEIIDGTIELGWVVSPEFHNKGFATEAVTHAIEDLFSRGYTEITAGAFQENPASMRVMEKSGMMRIEKTEEIEYRGKTHHCVFYAIRRP